MRFGGDCLARPGWAGDGECGGRDAREHDGKAKEREDNNATCAEKRGPWRVSLVVAFVVVVSVRVGGIWLVTIPGRASQGPGAATVCPFRDAKRRWGAGALERRCYFSLGRALPFLHGFLLCCNWKPRGPVIAGGCSRYQVLRMGKMPSNGRHLPASADLQQTGGPDGHQHGPACAKVREALLPPQWVGAAAAMGGRSRRLIGEKKTPRWLALRFGEGEF